MRSRWTISLYHPPEETGNRCENLSNNQHRSVDENVLNSINSGYSSSTDSVATLKNEDFRNSEFSTTISPVHNSVTSSQKTELKERRCLKETVDIHGGQTQCQNTIMLSPNGDRISVVSIPQKDETAVTPERVAHKTSIQRCHSVYSHCNNDLATIAGVKRNNRKSYDGKVWLTNNNEMGRSRTTKTSEHLRSEAT